MVEERKALATATEAFEREQAEQVRLARIDGFKETFESQAKATDVANAAKTLESLRKEVGAAADPFVVTEAPRMLATAYYKLATQQAQDKHDFAAALKFAKACADLQPQRQECKLAVRDYTVDGNKQELDKTFARGEFDLGDALVKISEVQVLDPGAFSEAEGRWAPPVTTRFGALRTAGPTNFNDLLKQAKDVFAGNQMIASIEPIKIGPAVAKTPTGPSSPIIAEIKSAIDKALLTKAKELLQKAAQSDGETPEIVQLKGIFNGKARQVKDVVTGIDARVTEGSGLIAQWQQDHADATNAKAKAVLVAAREELDGAFAIWADSTALQQRKLKIADELARLTAGPHAEPAVPPAPPTDPCEAKLAGYGKRKAGTCFYFVSGKQPGPYMVVVPAGEGIAKPFAIGKYEVTVADFNRYCRLSGKCQPNTTDEGALPITGITLAQAKEFLDWLSERTGQKFRLPTVAEWTYAATAAAAGEQPKKDYNCRVEQGGQLLKGQGTMGVNTGKANGWGLYNYVGNAQEWATAGSGVVARGGAFEDSFSKCDISLEKPHSGTADHATGFRALLELGS